MRLKQWQGLMPENRVLRLFYSISSDFDCSYLPRAYLIIHKQPRIEAMTIAVQYAEEWQHLC
jgi:hypothetical protein